MPACAAHTVFLYCAPDRQRDGEIVTVRILHRLLDRFWDWYERHYTLNVGIAAILFLLQLVHLYWLTTDVVLFRLLGESYFFSSPQLKLIIILVDYTEIPAIITTSLVYIHELRDHFQWKPFAYLLFVDIQILHLFWITDEFVVEQFQAAHTGLFPIWLAWIAILIDYLELPVIFETFRKFIDALRSGDSDAVGDAFRHEPVPS